MSAYTCKSAYLWVWEAPGQRYHVGRGGSQQFGHLPDEGGLPGCGHTVKESRVNHLQAWITASQTPYKTELDLITSGTTDRKHGLSQVDVKLRVLSSVLHTVVIL